MWWQCTQWNIDKDSDVQPRSEAFPLPTSSTWYRTKYPTLPAGPCCGHWHEERSQSKIMRAHKCIRCRRECTHLFSNEARTGALKQRCSVDLSTALGLTARNRQVHPPVGPLPSPWWFLSRSQTPSSRTCLPRSTGLRGQSAASWRALSPLALRWYCTAPRWRWRRWMHASPSKVESRCCCYYVTRKDFPRLGGAGGGGYLRWGEVRWGASSEEKGFGLEGWDSAGGSLFNSIDTPGYDTPRLPIPVSLRGFGRWLVRPFAENG